MRKGNVEFGWDELFDLVYAAGWPYLEIVSVASSTYSSVTHDSNQLIEHAVIL